MNIDDMITEKVRKFEDFKKQIIDINNQIGALQEQGRALHQAALEIRGGIDALAQLKAKDDEGKNAKALILPDKTLVASDGKTPIAKVEETPAAPVAEAPKAEEKAPVTLEVQ